MSKYISAFGIILVMIGTIFSLWSIIVTKSNYVGTFQWLNDQQNNFKKDKKKIIIGTILIIMGSIFQIVGLFL